MMVATRVQARDGAQRVRSKQKRDAWDRLLKDKFRKKWLLEGR